MGSAAFFAPEAFTSPCSEGPPFMTILSIGSCVSPPWRVGRGLCPKCHAVAPLQVLLHARVRVARALEQLPDGGSLGFPNLQCKESARLSETCGPLRRRRRMSASPSAPPSSAS